LAQKINNRRDLVRFPERTARASHLNALGLLDEIFHFIVEEYCRQVNPDLFQDALERLDSSMGSEVIDSVLLHFAENFPTTPHYKGELEAEEYILAKTEGKPNRQILLEELMMLWLDNENPAAAVYRELFDHQELVQKTDYLLLLNELYDFFQNQPVFGPDGENLIDMLRRPALESPDSLAGQLTYIQKKWGTIIGALIYRLLNTLDFIQEETKPVFGVGGPGPARVLEFAGQEFEPENFSADLDWMPRLILMAKNTYVWLDQLSKKYHRAIRRLNEIPDDELNTLRRWGFTGLWLIGLWERSKASQRIKQMRGNPEAVASAYSLYEYQIATDLGGEEAYIDLRERAWQRGIRLSADMVPNHMGIDSRWVIQHPDWFIALDYSPFPTYTYSGPNLSSDERVGIYLEDHYYNNSDAAVVFKRVDQWTGSEKYVYHGNDGTSMPWNDTAQLNYLLPEVREAAIQTILEVARKFPVIRFDAAMTLSKKHYQRLWFPEPGSGGDIPSRAEFGLNREQFDAAMPVEFWREVVDRVAQEVPDTLLLAEAFWMMEGYFVRTLGMHRVYNSAFMNMLRDEKNAEYRLVIKNTLEFDPEVLKRYVNFMNNPDERTTIDQFGKGDKYFGICTLMCTMPGLPMFGHGQLEGFAEKYGMEYQKAYWDEVIDQDLVQRHEKEIFPVLRRRYQFADVENFLLYDFYTQDGSVNEDVFVYSNQAGEQKSLVVYHNRFGNTSGWIKTSAAYAVKTVGEEGGKKLVQRELHQGLSLNNDPAVFVIYKDHVTGLEYLRNSREIHERGLYLELHAYQCHVFLDFRQVTDSVWHPYAQLAAHLNGRGVSNMDEALKELVLQPLLRPFGELANAAMIRWITMQRVLPKLPDGTQYLAVMEEFDLKMRNWLSEVKNLSQGEQELEPITVEARKKLGVILRLPAMSQLWLTKKTSFKKIIQFIGVGDEDRILGGHLGNGNPQVWGLLLCWLYTHPIGQCIKNDPDEADQTSRSLLEEWLLVKTVRSTLMDCGLDGYSAGKLANLLRVLVAHHGWWKQLATRRGRKASLKMEEQTVSLLNHWLEDEAVHEYIGVNRYGGIDWFNQESFEEVLWWLFLIAVLEIIATQPEDQLRAGQLPSSVLTHIRKCFSVVENLLSAQERSGYQLEKLISFAQQKELA
jgi:glycosidase